MHYTCCVRRTALKGYPLVVPQGEKYNFTQNVFAPGCIMFGIKLQISWNKAFLESAHTCKLLLQYSLSLLYNKWMTVATVWITVKLFQRKIAFIRRNLFQTVGVTYFTDLNLCSVVFADSVSLFTPLISGFHRADSSLQAVLLIAAAQCIVSVQFHINGLYGVR